MYIEVCVGKSIFYLGYTLEFFRKKKKEDENGKMLKIIKAGY